MHKNIPERIEADFNWWDEDQRLDAIVTVAHADGHEKVYVVDVLPSLSIDGGFLWMQKRGRIGNQVLIPASTVLMIEIQPDQFYRPHDDSQPDGPTTSVDTDGE